MGCQSSKDSLSAKSFVDVDLESSLAQLWQAERVAFAFSSARSKVGITDYSLSLTPPFELEEESSGDIVPLRRVTSVESRTTIALRGTHPKSGQRYDLTVGSSIPFTQKGLLTGHMYIGTFRRDSRRVEAIWIYRRHSATPNPALA